MLLNAMYYQYTVELLVQQRKTATMVAAAMLFLPYATQRACLRAIAMDILQTPYGLPKCYPISTCRNADPYENS
jgi:hypothetical protein